MVRVGGVIYLKAKFSDLFYMGATRTCVQIWVIFKNHIYIWATRRNIKFSANQLLVLVRDEDNNYLNVISFENENDFIYL